MTQNHGIHVLQLIKTPQLSHGSSDVANSSYESEQWISKADLNAENDWRDGQPEWRCSTNCHLP